VRKVLSSLRLILGFAFQADRRLAIWALVLWGAFSSMMVIFSLWLRFLVDGVVRQDFAMAMLGAGALALTFSVAGITNWIGINLANTLSERTSLYIDQRLIDLTTRISGIEHHERPDYLREMDLLRNDRWQLSAAVAAVIGNFGTLIMLLSTAILLTSIHPLLLTLPVFGIPSLFAAAKWESKVQRTREATIETSRLANHLFELTTTSGPGKELRIFGLPKELTVRQDKLWREVDQRWTRTSLWGAAVSALGWTAFAVGYVGAIGFVVLRAARGLATPGEALMAVSLASQVNQQVSQAVGGVTWLFQSLKSVERYQWLVDYESKSRVEIAEVTPVPSSINQGIEIHRLSFRYPGTEVDVLEDLNLNIPASSTIAIVGDNGAGKTTLVKLLSRFYEPTRGRISVDGTDLLRFDVVEWRARMAAGFQDFGRFEFLARETVGVGDLPMIDHPEIVRAALVRASGDDVLPALSNGLETQLGKTFEEGTELSMGQWQKLALGRAMMRETPLLLVLDEPTASLDAMTEHALFERYAGAARRLASANGGITVLVSHRFSTVRMADLIVVIDKGRVVETGSHGELMANRGLYAELFDLQARAYR
jgi:ATP-binding cassette subfamily B protein